jgi:hypothetical protein
MRQAGTWLFIFGVGSMLLNLVGMEFRLLMWVDSWGPTVGWSIRGGIAALGAVLFLLGRKVEGAGVPAA